MIADRVLRGCSRTLPAPGATDGVLAHHYCPNGLAARAHQHESAPMR